MDSNQKLSVTRNHVCGIAYVWILVFALHQVNGQANIGDECNYTDIDACDGVDPNSDCYRPDPNSPGGETCQCDDGYLPIEGISICQEINACTEHTSTCLGYGTCTNRVGSFPCACRSEYTGDGVECNGFGCNWRFDNACSDEVPNSHCYKPDPNSEGGSTCQCDDGYIHISGTDICQEGTSNLIYVEPTSDGDVGTRGSIAQGATGIVYTVDVTTADAYVITDQVPSGVLEFASALSGAVSVVTGQTIDSAISTTHVMTVTAGNSVGTTGTITLTLTVYGVYYINPAVCYDLRVGNIAGPIHTSAASGASTIVYTLSGTAYTGYTFIPASGVIENDALITSNTKPEKVVTVVTATEHDGAAGTATQTVFFCINGDCNCDLNLNLSGATCPTVSFMIMVSAFILQVLK